MSRGMSNIERVRSWVEQCQPGERFRANTVAKELNLSPSTVASTLKWQDNVKQERRYKDSVADWVRV